MNYNIGVDIGGSKVAIAVVDDKGLLYDKKIIKNNSNMLVDDLIVNIYSSINKIIEGKKYQNKIKTVGIGVPGKVDKNGFVCAPNIKLNNVDIKDKLHRYLNIPVLIENDANCAAIAEYRYGSLKNTKNALLITLGTGIGGGIIINNKLYTGSNGGAGEIGHQVIVKDGIECNCGRKGCWEKYASTLALVNRIKEDIEGKDSILLNMVNNDISKLDAKMIFDAIDKKDKYSIEKLAEHIEYLMIGIINLDQIFDFDMISIGGGVSKRKNILMDMMLENIEKQKNNLFKFDTSKLKIATLGNDAGIIGASEIVNML